MASEANEILYPRAPILEAVVELRFAEIPAKRVRKAADDLRARYDELKEEEQIEGTLDFAQRTSKFRVTSPKIRLASWDQTDLLILTATNVVWSRLAPYEGWQPFADRISDQLPKLLKTIAQPPLSRIGLRYINRIDVPKSDDNLCHHEQFLTFRIDAGEILEPHNGYQWALQKEFPEEGFAATVISATVASELPNQTSVTFDIDIFKAVDVPSGVDDILNCLTNMRNLKNRIFEAGITDKARALFNATNA